MANLFIPTFENHWLVPNQTCGIYENTIYVLRWIPYFVMEKWLTWIAKVIEIFTLFEFFEVSTKKNLLERFFRLLNKFLNTVSGSEQVVV